LEIGWHQVTKLSVAKVRHGVATLKVTTRKGTTYWFLAKERDLRRLSGWLEDIKKNEKVSAPGTRKAENPLEPSLGLPTLGSAWKLHHVRERGSHSAGFKAALPSRLHQRSLAPQTSRMQKVLFPLTAMALLLGTTLGLSPRVHSRLATARRHVVAPHQRRMSEKALLALIRAEQHGQFFLAPATKAPAPAPAKLANAAPLARHEVFGFVPYWMLPLENSLHVSPYTTIAYFGIDIAPNGQLVQSGTGWEGYQSADLASLITRAHRDGVRVVLTAKCFNQSTLNALTHDTEADKVLAYQLALAIEAKNFDGVNLDLEGTGPYDRSGLVKLVGVVSRALHEVNPHWQVTMDVYASSASNPGGFFDVARLAPEVNAFFVMAYDMQNPSVPSPTAPLWGTKSFNDLDAVADYIRTVPSTKVILGVPFYGEEWQTSGPELGAQVISGPVAVTYAQIAAANLPSYWDGATQTAWTSFRYHGSWYQIDYDNPKSVALKANLAMFFHLRGIGAWALGMQGTNSGMTAALLGKAPPLHDLVKGPPGPLPVPTNPLPSSNGSKWLIPQSP
jgi:spore germination protein YaaH